MCGLACGYAVGTTAAIAGWMTGAAHYAQSGIPMEWLGKLTMVEEIGTLAEQLVLNNPNIEKVNSHGL